MIFINIIDPMMLLVLLMCAGEQSERLWSHLSKFIRITTQMSPSTRKDFLSFAFRFNNQHKEDILLESLTEKFQEVCQMHVVAVEKLKQLENQMNKTRAQVREMKLEYQNPPEQSADVAEGNYFSYIYMYIYIYIEYIAYDRWLHPHNVYTQYAI